MLQVTTRQIGRLIADSENVWAWYELAKSGVSLGEALGMCRNHGFNENIAMAGYQELQTDEKSTLTICHRSKP